MFIFDEEEKLSETSEVGAADYIATIKELKKTSVPRKDYEALVEEKKMLLNSIVNGQEEEGEDQELVYSDEDIKKFREALFNSEDKELTNLEYAVNAINLREAILQKTNGKTDIFVGTNNQFEPSQNDYFRAENTAETLKECIDYAKGDSELFTQELQRRMKR